jgi:imidazole glycerol-phosphate synthase subunit HisF
MLKVRVIPTLLWKDFGLVKGVGFDSWRRIGPLLPAIKVYNSREVDELILVDIMASREGNIPDYESLDDFADECFIPLTVGGGITNLSQIISLLNSGADKISLNSALFDNPCLVDKASYQFGVQCIVASIDVRRLSDRFICFSHAGTQNTQRETVSWARELADRGAGEILLTSIDRDGTMQGYDLELIEKVVSAVNIPVIASGGAGNYQHMIDAVKQAGASSVAAASIFHFTEQTPSGAKVAMRDEGIPVRQNLS